MFVRKPAGFQVHLRLRMCTRLFCEWVQGRRAETIVNLNHVIPTSESVSLPFTCQTPHPEPLRTHPGADFRNPNTPELPAGSYTGWHRERSWHGCDMVLHALRVLLATKVYYAKTLLELSAFGEGSLCSWRCTC